MLVADFKANKVNCNPIVKIFGGVALGLSPFIVGHTVRLLEESLTERFCVIYAEPSSSHAEPNSGPGGYVRSQQKKQKDYPKIVCPDSLKWLDVR